MSNRFNQSKRPQNPNIAPFVRKRHAIITVVVDAQNWFAMVVLKCCVFVQHVILLDLCYSFEINQYLYTCLYSSCSAESRLFNEYNITAFGQKHSEKSAKLWVNSTKWVRTKIYLVDNVKERNFQFFVSIVFSLKRHIGLTNVTLDSPSVNHLLFLIPSSSIQQKGLHYRHRSNCY